MGWPAVMPAQAPWPQRAWHRFFDLTAAALGLLLLAPLFGAIALLIFWKDGLPVFFTQMRAGRYGRLFRLWKFRTMTTGVSGRSITAGGDPRVTPVGAVLRKYKLDELPQLFNVFLGQMSLVGPRPEVPEYVELRSPIWQTVLQVRPGITDLASLLYRNEEEILAASGDPDTFYRERVLPAKLIHNIDYLRSRSFSRDLRLILLTIGYSVLPGRFDPRRIATDFFTGVRNAGQLHPLSPSIDR